VPELLRTIADMLLPRAARPVAEPVG